jgi:transposase-like protein
MRWTPKRKAEIAEAIRNGHLTPAEAKKRHGLSDEELAAWMRDYRAHGRAGLRVTQFQRYHPRRSKLISKANGHQPQEPPISGIASGLC